MSLILLLLFLFLGISCIPFAGIDVSAYEKTIEWKSVAKTKKFAIIRAGYGARTIDDYWEKNYIGAKIAGIKVGAYWYSYAHSVEDAKKEAKMFLKALIGKQLEWPVYYYIEEQFIYTQNLQNSIAKEFCGILQLHYYFCGIYTSVAHLIPYYNSDVKNKYEIWVPDYGPSKPLYVGDFGIWQTGIGKVEGVDGDCYLDFGYKDYEEIIKKGEYNGYSSN